jgi:tether containing UBX domain for GLUT4
MLMPRYKKNMLDLSLSMRFANLAPGAKLELVKIEAPISAVSSVVGIALQTEESGRMMGQFQADTSLWSILLSFEERSKGFGVSCFEFRSLLNLTRRTGKPNAEQSKVFSLKAFVKAVESLGKKAEKVYFQPVVIIMTKEVYSKVFLPQV